MTGGLIKPLCDPAKSSEANKKKPADSAQGAAARIKAEEAEAKAKIADIEFLATKNCKRYPEAEAALINALRAEKQECVRLAAAKALARGCCCSAKVMKALTMTVNCSTKDTFPAEESERVRLFAFLALERCLAACQPSDEEPPEKPGDKKEKDEEKKEAEKAALRLSDGEILPTTYYTTTFERIPQADVFAEARLTIHNGLKVSSEVIANLSGPKNLADIVSPNLPGNQAPPIVPINRLATMPPSNMANARQPKSIMSILQNAWVK